MAKKFIFLIVSLLLLFAVTVSSYALSFPCWYEKKGEMIEVKFSGYLVMRLRGDDAEKRAGDFVTRINSLWKKGILFRKFEAVKAKGGGYIIRYGKIKVFEITMRDAQRNKTTPFYLAAKWLNNLCYGMSRLQAYRLWSRRLSHPRTMVGYASWYGGRRWNMKRTASGELFWDRKLVAASKTLPFNSLVKVTDLKTGRWVIVRIIDRGPYVKGRIVDLSKLAAELLNMVKKGVIKVKVEVIQWDDRFGGKR